MAADNLHPGYPFTMCTQANDGQEIYRLFRQELHLDHAELGHCPHWWVQISCRCACKLGLP